MPLRNAIAPEDTVQPRLVGSGGFTLVEMVVVVMVVSLLMAIALPTYLTGRDSAKDAAALSNAVNAYTNEMAYYAEQSLFVPSLDGGSLDAQLPWATTAPATDHVFAEVATPTAPFAWQTSSGSRGDVLYVAAVGADNSCFMILSDQNPASGSRYTGYMETTAGQGCLGSVPTGDVTPVTGRASAEKESNTGNIWYTTF